MDNFESRLKSLPLRPPSEPFGKPETWVALRATAIRPLTVWQRLATLPRMSPLAAAVALAAFALALYVVLADRSDPSAAFAQFTQKLRAAQTLSYDSHRTSLVDGKTLEKSRVFAMEPGKWHEEFFFPQPDAETFNVYDIPAGKILTVIPKEKTAVITAITGKSKFDPAHEMIDFLCSLDEKDARPLGEKHFDTVRARGFQIDTPSDTTTVWADLKTGTPVRIEIVRHNVSKDADKEVLTNIKLDEKLDPALFSLEPPPGYQVRNNIALNLDATPADYLVGLLSTYAKYMDGEFPSRLGEEGLTAFREKLQKQGLLEPGKIPNEDDLLQFASHADGLHARIPRQQQGQSWQYYPGAKLGQKDRLVFWWLDSKTKKYLAVYADLRIAETSKERLAAPPAAERVK